MKKQIIKACLIIILMSFNPAFATSTNKFITVADIHFNPFAGCKTSLARCDVVNELRAADYHDWEKILSKYDTDTVSSVGEDTNYHLFKLTIAELRVMKQQEHPQFGLLLGDFLAHRFKEKYVQFSHDLSKSGYDAFVQKTLQYLTLQLHTVFSDINLFPVIGNNDSYTGDYSVVPQGKFLHDTANTWSTLILDKNSREQLLQSFPTAGYYAVTFPDSQHRIILLDTVLFSSRAHHVEDAAEQQLTWLKTQLASAKAQHQHVLLAFHIPVGIDVYATLKNKLGGITKYWHDNYAHTFSSELQHYSMMVDAILPAHIHIVSFQMITVNKIANIPVIFTPAISPIFGNNPGFKLFWYDASSWRVKDDDTYFLPLGKSRWERTGDDGG